MVTEAGSYSPEVMLEQFPLQGEIDDSLDFWFLIVRSGWLPKAGAKHIEEYPHWCPRCKGKAYVGFNTRVVHAAGTGEDCPRF